MGKEITITSDEQLCDLMCGQTKEHEFCLRCGRRLKNEEARKLGYGKVCFEKMQIKDKTNPLF